jgi:hypothetical protein
VVTRWPIESGGEGEMSCPRWRRRSWNQSEEDGEGEAKKREREGDRTHLFPDLGTGEMIRVDMGFYNPVDLVPPAKATANTG